MVKNVVKRDGLLVDFNSQKIVAAILKAMAVTEAGEDIVLAAQIADSISKQGKEKMSVEDLFSGSERNLYPQAPSLDLRLLLKTGKYNAVKTYQ